MTDQDDAVAFMLDYAFQDLHRCARTSVAPHLVYEEFFFQVIAVLVSGNWPGRSLESLMLIVARRVVSDFKSLA